MYQLGKTLFLPSHSVHLFFCTQDFIHQHFPNHSVDFDKTEWKASVLESISVAGSLSYSFREQLYKHYIHHLVPNCLVDFDKILWEASVHSAALHLSFGLGGITFSKKVFQNLLHQLLPNVLMDFSEHYRDNSVICILAELWFFG